MKEDIEEEAIIDMKSQEWHSRKCLIGKRQVMMTYMDSDFKKITSTPRQTGSTTD